MEVNSYKKGLADGLPIGLGYLSVSFAFGIYAVSMGLTPFEVLMISMTNVTSAGQLAAVPIMTYGGTLIELAVAQLIINLRYALMSVSLSQKLGKSVKERDRFLIAFMNTDEVFAVASSQGGDVGRKYLFGLITLPYIGWSVGTLLGACAGTLLPASIISALGIAIYAMFVAIVVPPMRNSKPTAFCVALAVVFSCAFYYIPALSNVPSGFVIIICAVTASAIFAALFPVRTDNDTDGGMKGETEE